MGNNGQLNERQRLFCEKIVVNPNATQAAIDARYSRRSASSIGHENLQKPKIQRYISQLRQERNLRTQVTADRVLAELAKITFAEKGVKTGYKLKALDMLAKHVGLYDEETRKYLEILKEKEAKLKKYKACIEEKDWGKRIIDCLSPNAKMQILYALQNKRLADKLIGSTETRLKPGDNGKDVEDDILKLLDKELGKERIKKEVLAKLNSLFGWSQKGRIR